MRFVINLINFLKLSYRFSAYVKLS